MAAENHESRVGWGGGRRSIEAAAECYVEVHAISELRGNQLVLHSVSGRLTAFEWQYASSMCTAMPQSLTLVTGNDLIMH